MTDPQFQRIPLRPHLSATTRVLLAVLIVACLGLAGCSTVRTERVRATPSTSSEAEAKAEPQEKGKEKQPQEKPQGDEEDKLLYRVLAAPEYLWEGFTYPFKKFGIFYERVDLMERALDFFLNEERTGGIYPRFSLGGAFSSGIGFTAFDNNLFHQQKQARFSYLFGTRNNQTGELFYKDPAVLGSEFTLETNLFGLKFDDSRFFPGGNRAREQDETRFELNQLALDVKVSRPVLGDLSASFTGRILIADAKGSDKNPPTPATVKGINTSVQAFAVEPGVRYDSRDSEFRPSTGWFFDSGFTFTEQANRDQFRYMGYWVEVQRYIPVFRGNRVLLLRGYLTKLDTLNDRSIPFYELPLLDLNNGLRGFDRGRWQDKGALLFNLEWRFPVWKDIEGDIFLDEGQVFGNYKDLQLKLFRYSAGGGFRFVTQRKFAFRVQIAGSEDGVLALIRGNLEFSRKRGTALLGF